MPTNFKETARMRQDGTEKDFLDYLNKIGYNEGTMKLQDFDGYNPFNMDFPKTKNSDITNVKFILVSF